MLVIVAPVTSSRLVALLAAAWAALAAYVSFGAIAFTGVAGARLGVLPLDAPHVAMAALVDQRARIKQGHGSTDPTVGDDVGTGMKVQAQFGFDGVQ